MTTSAAIENRGRMCGRRYARGRTLSSGGGPAYAAMSANDERLRALHPAGMVTTVQPLRGRRSPRSLVSVAALLIGGCSWNTPQTTLVPHSDFARSILYVYGITTWISLGIALVVFVVLAIVLVRFRARPGGPPPTQTRGHTLLEISWTVAPALVLLVIAIPTIQIVFRTQGPSV